MNRNASFITTGKMSANGWISTTTPARRLSLWERFIIWFNTPV
jgi:hypothetical protein